CGRDATTRRRQSWALRTSSLPASGLPRLTSKAARAARSRCSEIWGLPFITGDKRQHLLCAERRFAARGSGRAVRLDESVRQQVEDPDCDAVRVVKGIAPRVAAILSPLRRIQDDQGPDREPDGYLAPAIELAYTAITQPVEVAVTDVREGQRMSHEAAGPASARVQARGGPAEGNGVGEVLATLPHRVSEEIQCTADGDQRQSGSRHGGHGRPRPVGAPRGSALVEPRVSRGPATAERSGSRSAVEPRAGTRVDHGSGWARATRDWH